MASEKYISKDSGFYDLLEQDDQEMADRDFQIKQSLLHFFRPEVSPGAPMKSQMISAEIEKNKGASNLRIHVECGINCIKSFSILNNTLPISLFQNIDDIL